MIAKLDLHLVSFFVIVSESSTLNCYTNSHKYPYQSSGLISIIYKTYQSTECDSIRYLDRMRF